MRGVRFGREGAAKQFRPLSFFAVKAKYTARKFNCYSYLSL